MSTIDRLLLLLLLFRRGDSRVGTSVPYAGISYARVQRFPCFSYSSVDEPFKHEKKTRGENGRSQKSFVAFRFLVIGLIFLNLLFY